MGLKFVISGGGTGGHIYPGIAIANAILELEPDAKILFIGGKGQRESKIIPEAGFEFIPILVQGFPRNLSWRWFKVFIKVPAGFFKSLVVLSKFKPDVVVGTGGYVCGPVLLAGLFLRKPIVIQEQNAFPGVTNRILGRWAKEIYTHFAESVKFFPS
ncbi:MAG: UDP-N-acetylglucosamine--N-acetylmuramyl-(pentapeptide) pyrophosphoryl-undecaprenol N-acetylglucosamine transferase, partial [Candidatus Poribacteria bacterium]